MFGYHKTFNSGVQFRFSRMRSSSAICLQYVDGRECVQYDEKLSPGQQDLYTRKHTVKKIIVFPTTSQDVTKQTLPGRALAIYAPMIYTTLCIMFWMRAYPLQGQVGGDWALEVKSFLGPVKWHRADR
jgi:hypothetical protein